MLGKLWKYSSFRSKTSLWTFCPSCMLTLSVSQGTKYLSLLYCWCPILQTLSTFLPACFSVCLFVCIICLFFYLPVSLFVNYFAPMNGLSSLLWFWEGIEPHRLLSQHDFSPYSSVASRRVPSRPDASPSLSWQIWSVHCDRWTRSSHKYRMTVKSCPFVYCKYTMKIGQDVWDIQSVQM